ncbi:MAG TPA: fibronectin type III domain-containing protein [candidate division Zixibacteria bacterium]
MVLSKKMNFLFILIIFASSCSLVWADQPPIPPTEVKGSDTKNDAGGSITLSWKRSPDDGAGKNNIVSYKVLRSSQEEGFYILISDVTAGAEQFLDNNAKDGIKYFYKIKAISNEGFSLSLPSPAIVSKAQWFDTTKIYILAMSVILFSAILYFISKAKSGKELFIRKIAGLDAVDEAVGRATEMGRKIIYIPGINDLDDIQTIAGITILGRVAKLVAEYEAKLEVPVSRSMVMVSCRETVKEAYINAGRPDAYSDDMVHYLTDDQFAYAAACDGIFVREKPAAIFLMGTFFAESLVLAETGNSVGAIQIAGTARPAQLPFFVAACDYTLIGEELFAASAYLSKDPKLLGSLRGQDVGKVLFLLGILVGTILISFNILDISFIFNVR